MPVKTGVKEGFLNYYDHDSSQYVRCHATLQSDSALNLCTASTVGSSGRPLRPPVFVAKCRGLYLEDPATTSTITTTPLHRATIGLETNNGIIILKAGDIQVVAQWAKAFAEVGGPNPQPIHSMVKLRCLFSPRLFAHLFRDTVVNPNQQAVPNGRNASVSPAQARSSAVAEQVSPAAMPGSRSKNHQIPPAARLTDCRAVMRQQFKEMQLKRQLEIQQRRELELAQEERRKQRIAASASPLGRRESSQSLRRAGSGRFSPQHTSSAAASPPSPASPQSLSRGGSYRRPEEQQDELPRHIDVHCSSPPLSSSAALLPGGSSSPNSVNRAASPPATMARSISSPPTLGTCTMPLPADEGPAEEEKQEEAAAAIDENPTQGAGLQERNLELELDLMTAQGRILELETEAKEQALQAEEWKRKYERLAAEKDGEIQRVKDEAAAERDELVAALRSDVEEHWSKISFQWQEKEAALEAQIRELKAQGATLGGTVGGDAEEN